MVIISPNFMINISNSINTYQTSSYPQWTASQLENLSASPYPDKFIHLHLCGQKINDAALKQLAMNAPELHYVNITDCMQITDRGLEDLFYFCTELESVVIDLNHTGVSIGTINKIKRQKPNAFHSPFNIKNRRWDFLLAVQSGEFGKPLVNHILTTFPKELSATTLEVALKILSHRNDRLTAEKVSEVRSQFHPILTSPDPMDIQILLFASSDPKSYSPLGKIPEEQGWAPLTLGELEAMSGRQGVPKRGYCPIFSGLKNVDDAQTELEPNEIRKTESRLFTGLYRLIKANRCKLQINGTREYRLKVLSLIEKILQTPSGRWLLLFVCRAKKRTNIIEGKNEFQANNEIDKVYLSSTTTVPLVARDKDDLIPHTFDQDCTLFHELLHKWQEDNNLLKALNNIISPNTDYSNLSEQFVIAGVDDQFLHLAPLIFQNRYHCERNYLSRYGHCSYKFFKEQPEPNKSLATLIAEERLPNLSRLRHWKVPEKISLGNFTKVAVRAPIRSLDFSYNPKIKDVWLSSLSRLCQKLTELNLEGCSITDEDLKKINAPELEILNVTNCTGISHDVLNQLPLQCRALKKIILTSSADIMTRSMKRKIDEIASCVPA